jgi:acetyl esterase/lipase
MITPTSFRAVYKQLSEQEIDVDIYLPPITNNSAKYPVRKFKAFCRLCIHADSLDVINIHGGAFMLGSSKMVNKDQVSDCLSRGWIVLAPNHRLCPQVNLLEGPMQDCRDLLAWVLDGGLETALRRQAASTLVPDLDHVFAFGTSSGGHLALCLVS